MTSDPVTYLGALALVLVAQVVTLLAMIWCFVLVGVV